MTTPGGDEVFAVFVSGVYYGIKKESLVVLYIETNLIYNEVMNLKLNLRNVTMRCFFAILSALAMLFSCKTTHTGTGDSGNRTGGLKVRDYGYNYEKIVFDDYRFKLEFHLGALEGDKKIEGLIKTLVYNGKEPDAYVGFKEQAVLGVLTKEDSPPQPGEEGKNIRQGQYIERVEIKNYGGAFVILRRENYLYYSGQAHGISLIEYYVLDLDEAKILSLNELSSPIPEDILKSSIASKFDIDFNYRKSVWPPDTISLEPEGLLLLWNVYSIAPYSKGPVEITVPYSLTDGYLTEKARLIRDKLTQ
jgi:hypothetical protein